ncbi:hypothetical protein L2U69_08085 [Zavarzinia compransoris]|uniref:hypothetical protein n=1 Tax=Zavarzinia marina TaxID=2911065 RepID=UPI001F19D3F1|nr:hypothetical protein [Zavarzinia marina]MCF4165597.1 hypothetical protein [Zavarzinia marina]
MIRALLLVLLCLVAGPLRAADFTVLESGRGADAVVVQGSIEAGDQATLDRIMKRPGGISFVLLDSTGGDLVEALAMGRMIYRGGARTVAGPWAVCASACALIWAAGVERMMSVDAAVGFHTAYSGPEHEASDVGNTMIGTYMRDLNYGWETIDFTVEAAAEDMQWLSFERGWRLGFEPLDLEALLAGQNGGRHLGLPPSTEEERRLGVRLARVFARRHAEGRRVAAEESTIACYDRLSARRTEWIETYCAVLDGLAGR